MNGKKTCIIIEEKDLREKERERGKNGEEKRQ